MCSLFGIPCSISLSPLFRIVSLKEGLYVMVRSDFQHGNMIWREGSSSFSYDSARHISLMNTLPTADTSTSYTICLTAHCHHGRSSAAAIRRVILQYCNYKTNSVFAISTMPLQFPPQRGWHLCKWFFFTSCFCTNSYVRCLSINSSAAANSSSSVERSFVHSS